MVLRWVVNVTSVVQFQLVFSCLCWMEYGSLLKHKWGLTIHYLLNVSTSCEIHVCSWRVVLMASFIQTHHCSITFLRCSFYSSSLNNVKRSWLRRYKEIVVRTVILIYNCILLRIRFQIRYFHVVCYYLSGIQMLWRFR